MESRKIIITSTKSQTKNVLETAATTLGELKDDMDKANIDYEGMTFYEGVTHTELKDDAAQLPTNVQFKGRTTNELVFVLTQPNKKISSGAYTRSELYDKVKELNLADKCKEEYGKNYTQCSSQQLSDLIESGSKKSSSSSVKSSKEKVTVEKEKSSKSTESKPVSVCCGVNQRVLKQVLNRIADAIDETGSVDDDTVPDIKEMIKKVFDTKGDSSENEKNSSKDLGGFSEDDIADMIDDAS